MQIFKTLRMISYTKKLNAIIVNSTTFIEN